MGDEPPDRKPDRRARLLEPIGEPLRRNPMFEYSEIDLVGLERLERVEDEKIVIAQFRKRAAIRGVGLPAPLRQFYTDTAALGEQTDEASLGEVLEMAEEMVVALLRHPGEALASRS